MLIKEILVESAVVEDINNDLMDFIVMYRNKNRPWAPMSGPNGAVRYMRSLDHDVDADDLMNVLAKPPFIDVVERSGPEHIKLKTTIPDSISDKAEERNNKRLIRLQKKQQTKQ